MLDSYKPQVDAINEHGIRVLEEDGTEGAGGVSLPPELPF